MLKFFCLAVFVGAANAIVCTPNTCQMVRCAAVTADSCDGVVKQNAGFCGCCDACITEIAEGGRCMALGAVLLGVPSTSSCADGLHCDLTTATCKKTVVKRDMTPCETDLAAYHATLMAQPHLLGLQKPRCESDGTYVPMQYSGSQAFCVTAGNGTMINGYMVDITKLWNTGTDISCQCARDQYDYQQLGIIGKMYFCDSNGSYASIGCTGSVCYCQDKLGKQVGTSTVGIWEKDSMNC